MSIPVGYCMFYVLICDEFNLHATMSDTLWDVAGVVCSHDNS
jgi:hypothetical protein